MSLNNYMHIALLLLPLCHMHGITTPAQLDAYPNHSADLRAARTIIIIWFSGHLHAGQPFGPFRLRAAINGRRSSGLRACTLQSALPPPMHEPHDRDKTLVHINVHAASPHLWAAPPDRAPKSYIWPDHLIWPSWDVGESPVVDDIAWRWR